ncbi:hypothetical protein [Streptomyces hydrogenans]|uniref:hypothetical protein n=1 Tax=Streptomyces hydrogenans TaxID=1873719 RepID=UPI0037F9DACC
MQYTEAKNLYPGAVVLDGADLRTVEYIDSRIRGFDGDWVRLTYARTEEERREFTPAVTRTYGPDNELLLAEVHAVAWRIRYHHGPLQYRRGTPPVHESYIQVPYCVRSNLAHHRNHPTAVELIEEHSVVAHRPIPLDELPGPGKPTPQPDGKHDKRFHKLFGFGPTVLPTGDDIRRRLEEIQNIHVREHGPVHEERGVRVRKPADDDFRNCLRCTRSPYDGMVMEVTIRRTRFQVTVADIPPEYEYQLGPEAAFHRHVLMGSHTPTTTVRPGPGIGNGDIVQYIVAGDRTTGYALARAKVVDSNPGNDRDTGVPQIVLAGPSGRPFRRNFSDCIRVDRTRTTPTTRFINQLENTK